MNSAERQSTFDARTWRLGAIPVALIATGLGVWLLCIAGDMPNPVASHWGGSGPADGYSSFASTAGIAFGATLGVGLLCATCLSLNSLTDGLHRIGIVFSLLMTGFIAGIFVAGLAPQIGQASATGTELQWEWVLLWGGIAAVAAVIAARLARHHGRLMVDAGIPTGAPVDAAAASRGESAVVRIRARAATYAIVGVICFAAFSALAFNSPWWVLVAVAFAVLVLSFFSAAVTAGPDGLSVTVWGRWRLVHVPVAAYGSATVELDADPLRYGGWGYRVGTWGTAFIVRRGPALVLAVAGGRQFVVGAGSAAHADRLAALLNGYKLREKTDRA